MAGGDRDERLCLGVITGPHGVRGQVRVKSFTENPEDIAAYGGLSDAQGRAYRLSLTGSAKGVLLARIEGVSDREAAEALKGTRLYVDRSALPAIEEEETYYHADLIGLRVEDASGRRIGRIREVQNFGAGDMLEVQGEAGESLLFAFTRQAVPVVDIDGGKVVVDPPEEIEARPPEGGGDAGSDTGQTGSGPA
jgi:16S rRNA processing protein RimM